MGTLRITEHGGKRQDEAYTDLITASGGIILGHSGRGAPIAVLRGVFYMPSDEGVAEFLHHRP